MQDEQYHEGRVENTNFSPVAFMAFHSAGLQIKNLHEFIT